MDMMSKGVLENVSPLEADVLRALEPGGKLKVKEVHAVVSKRHRAQVTSIAVMLDRLHSKKLVGRKMETCRGGTRYIYFLSKKPEEMEQDYLEKQVDSIISKFGDSAVAYFHKRFAENKK